MAIIFLTMRTRNARHLAVTTAAIGLIGAVACGGGSGSPSAPTSPTATAGTPTVLPTPAPSPSPSEVTWGFNGQAWQASGTPPACPSPLTLQIPVDLSRVTSVLYPGQTRGGNYKAHGGFRFDGSGETNSVTVSAPMAAAIVRGARYIEGGETQYLFDFINGCGVMYRFDHLLVLASRFQALAETLPPASASTVTTNFAAGQTVSAAETIATAVGFRASQNVSVDWGVYDLRQMNAAAQNAAWLASHPGDQAPYGVCWFDNLSAGDAARVRSLPPADGQAGRTSDYCR